MKFFKYFLKIIFIAGQISLFLSANPKRRRNDKKAPAKPTSLPEVDQNEKCGVWEVNSWRTVANCKKGLKCDIYNFGKGPQTERYCQVKRKLRRN